MKELLKKMSQVRINAVLLLLALFTVAVVVTGYLYSSDVLVVVLLALILDGAAISLYVLINFRRAYSSELETLSQHIAEKPSAEEVEKLVKKNKHEVADVVEKYTRNLYSQLEALNNIQEKFELKKPLPSLTGGAASPEFALLITDIVENNQHKTIVDIGSGISSLVAGYAAKNIEGSEVLALDHEEEFYLKTKHTIENHGLLDTVKVTHAPLKEYKLKDGKYKWYEDEELEKIKQIDLLLVDGPPGAIQKNSRYPAMPLLYEKLSPQATIIVDDYKREDERQMVSNWLQDYPDFDLEIVDSLKGIAILTRK